MSRIPPALAAIALAACLNACVAQPVPEPEAVAVATADVSVDQILQSRFDRVPGPATGGAALDIGEPGSWYDYAVVFPTVDYDGKLYRLWFAGLTMTDRPGVPYGWYSRLGLATSSDGVNWTVANGGRPVLDLGPKGSFDAMGVTHPYVLRVGNEYMLWYGGISGGQAGDVGVTPAHVRIERVGLATSPDGIHWRRRNAGQPVMDIGPAGAIDSVQATGMHVLQIDGQFVMWYGAYNGTHTLGIAISPDGVNWTKGNNGESLAGLAGDQQMGPSVYFDGSQYLMVYNHNLPGKNGGTIWTAFAATSMDGINWAPARDDQPLLGPAPPGNFGSADGVRGNNHVAHPTKMIAAANSVRIWYFAEANEAPAGSKYPPQRIGLMAATLE